jgi:ATP-binding protein involved in chromosome partitioning
MSEITQAQVLDALRNVIDIDLNKDIVSLGFVQDIEIDNGTVRFRLVLTTPACPMKNQMKAESEKALKNILGVKNVEIKLDSSTCASRKPEERLPGVKHIILVGSGKGGVGKSTIAVNLAAALVETGASVGILDADIYGPSIPPMMGLHEPPRVVEGKMMPIKAHGIGVMSIGFLVRDEDALVWRGPILHKVLTQFVEDVDWGELDYLVVDLPPGTGDVQISLSQIVKASEALLVSTPQEISFRDVRRAASMFNKIDIPIIGLIENMSTFICPHCGTETEIFPCSDPSDRREISPGFSIDVIGRIPIEPEIAGSCEAGVPAVIAKPDSKVSQRFRDLAGKVAARLSVFAKEQVAL